MSSWEQEVAATSERVRLELQRMLTSRQEGRTRFVLYHTSTPYIVVLEVVAVTTIQARPRERRSNASTNLS